jgi:hypothetical protein
MAKRAAAGTLALAVCLGGGVLGAGAANAAIELTTKKPIVYVGATGDAASVEIESAAVTWAANGALAIRLPAQAYFTAEPTIKVEDADGDDVETFNAEVISTIDDEDVAVGYDLTFSEAETTATELTITIEGIKIGLGDTYAGAAVALSVAPVTGAGVPAAPLVTENVSIADASPLQVTVPADQTLSSTGIQAVQPITIKETVGTGFKNAGTYTLTFSHAVIADPTPADDEDEKFTVKLGGTTGIARNSSVGGNEGDASFTLDINNAGSAVNTDETLTISNLFIMPDGTGDIEVTLSDGAGTDLPDTRSLGTIKVSDLGNRIGGFDRYATAAQVAQSVAATINVGNSALAAGAGSTAGLDPSEESLDDVILASGEQAGGGIDALSASYLAGQANPLDEGAGPVAQGAPVLLTEKASVPSETLSAIRNILATGPEYDTAGEDDFAGQTIHVLGGVNAISAEAVEDLEDAFEGIDIQRYAGDNRYATAAQAAGRAGGPVGTYAPSFRTAAKRTAILTSGTNPADALSAGSVSFAGKHPLLLTAPAALSTETKASLTSLGIKQVLLVGGTSAVSAAVEAEVKALGIDVIRVAGDDRYDTAAKLLTLANDEIGSAEEPANGLNLDLGYTGVGAGALLTNGQGFADALVSAPLAAVAGKALLPTDPTKLSPQTAAFIKASDMEDGSVIGLGGLVALPQSVLDAANDSADGDD